MNYFNLFSNILITKGLQRVLISDLQRDKSELFPLEFSDIIEELKKNSIENVIESYDLESQAFIEEYIEILLDNEFGFITEESWDNNFPPFSYEFSLPNEITNAYLEVNDLNCLSKISDSLSNLGAEHIVIYYDKFLNVDNFEFIEKIFQNSTITSVEIFSLYNDSINEVLIEKFDSLCKRVYSLVFYNCKNIPFKFKDKYRFTIKFVKQNIEINSCGKVNLEYFNTNLPKVLEAINHNSCLYKKISVDKNGNIKNCPAMPQSFGNINHITLEQALNHNDFKKYWNLTKDEIEVCKDCEFRNICTDCRAFTEQTNFNISGLDISKPLKCGYNPYTGQWDDWSKNPLKQKAIKYYGFSKKQIL